MGERFAAGLAASGAVHELVLADLSPELAVRVATVSSSADCIVRLEPLDARRQQDVEALVRRTTPDLIIQAAALQSPWALVGREDPAARALAAAGLGLRLPLQLPVLLSVMRAIREVGFTGPVANISLPDLTHPILHKIGLAPTVGLGNVSMLLIRRTCPLAGSPVGYETWLVSSVDAGQLSGAVSPKVRLARGFVGILDCCFEHVSQNLGSGDPLRATRPGCRGVRCGYGCDR